MIRMKLKDTIDFHIKGTWHTLTKMYNRIAAQHGASQTVAYILVNIDKEGTPATQIAARLGMEPTSLSRVLKKMEDQDLILKEVDENDKRIMKIFLTDYGVEKRKLVKEILINFNQKLNKIISKKELEPGIIKRVILKNKFLFFSLLLRHIGAASVWTIFPIMLMDQLGAELYQISIIYISNTLAAFILMNLMANKINISNITKFKIGIGMTTFVFVGLSFISDWWMAMPFMALVGGTWAFLFIGGNFHLMENNPRSTSTGIFSSTLSIATVIGPITAGVIAFAFDYVSVMYFAIAIILCAFAVSLKIKK